MSTNLKRTLSNGEPSKVEDTRVEHFDQKDAHHDQLNNVLSEERVYMTDEQSVIVRKKIDRVILPILAWVYFLQILDKSVVGYGAIFGMQEEANLVGKQYSLIGSSGYWAQLGAQPLIAFLIVKFPSRVVMCITVFCWGVSMCGLAASTNYSGLIACRFLLGLFEAACLPLFTVITTTWYRRSEQPLRIALWYGTNGLASMFGSFLAWALSFITGGSLYVYQILFLIVGLTTVLTSPLIWWRIDSSPATARFLTEEERLWAIERLRDNNSGAVTTTFNWNQVLEVMWSPISWMFIALTFCVNVGASTTNTFGPLIINGFGFDSRQTILLNIPFGFVQVLVILLASYCTQRFKRKSVMLCIFLIPCVAGSAMLYGLGRSKADEGPLLAGYYLIAFLFACNPLIVAWIASNVAGQTKKAAMMALYQAGSSSGNIVGPLLFKTKDKPAYRPGLQAVMGIFVASMGLVLILMGMFMVMNKRKEVERVKNGKPAKIHDRSMDTKYVAAEQTPEDEEDGIKGTTALGGNAFKDISDFKNDEFVYTL